MSGEPDRTRVAAKPFVVARDADGNWRLTVRETRFNSQNFPVVTARPIDQAFASAKAARDYARERFGALTGEFASK